MSPTLQELGIDQLYIRGSLGTGPTTLGRPTLDRIAERPSLCGAVLVTVAALLSPALARADVSPNPLCGEGMVLQRDSKVNIWGDADKGETVTVTFRGRKASAAADDQGKWLVALDSGEAGGSLPMTIAGKNTIEYKDVMVGEVWFCAGQSNLEPRCDPQDEDGKLITAAPPNPNLRYISLPVPDNKHHPRWASASPESAVWWSSVAYFFGRDVQKALGTPVGFIAAPVGGVRAEAWAPREAFPVLPKWVGGAGEYGAQYDAYVRETRHYAIRGAVWYQGESNTERGYEYRHLLPLLVKSWREAWRLGDFPFLYVQLPPYKPAAEEPSESSWAELRESQLLTLSTPNTGMAVTTDCGDEADIHPRPKHPVGERLALLARALAYKEDIEYSGPLFKEMKIDGRQAVVSFTHVGGGLAGKEMVPLLSAVRGDKKLWRWRVKPGGSDDAPLTGFTVCGADRKFHVAKAKINGETVVVTCDAVEKPVAVRYGWADHPLCNLYNKAALPASPFRTDDFPGITGPGK